MVTLTVEVQETGTDGGDVSFTVRPDIAETESTSGNERMLAVMAAEFISNLDVLARLVYEGAKGMPDGWMGAAVPGSEDKGWDAASEGLNH